jgi:hypothetical protein
MKHIKKEDCIKCVNLPEGVVVAGHDHRIKMPCLECGKSVEVGVGSLEHKGVFNVFCTGGDCEDRYAFKQ